MVKDLLKLSFSLNNHPSASVKNSKCFIAMPIQGGPSPISRVERTFTNNSRREVNLASQITFDLMKISLKFLVSAYNWKGNIKKFHTKRKQIVKLIAEVTRLLRCLSHF